MPLIHCWQDIEDLGGENWLTEAERNLIAACVESEECELGDGKLPPEGTAAPDREVRANVLRYLILGGCEARPVRGWGVRLSGGHVTGDLDLSFASARGITQLNFCQFERQITALQTRFELLNLSGSHFPALNAQGAQVTGHVLLRGVTAKGKVNLAGAEIGGQLACLGAKFKATTGFALNAQGVRVAGDVFFTDATAARTVSLAEAKITGQLACEGATFEADEGELQEDKRNALIAQRLHVGSSLVWREVQTPRGKIDFASAHVGDLADDPDSWPDGGRVYLDGFTYDRISGAFTDARRRIAWLEKGTYWKGNFLPQPFTHLAGVLRAMGHDADARRVLCHRERLIHRNTRERARIPPDGRADGALHKLKWRTTNAGRLLWDVTQRLVMGYGHHPFRSILWLIGLIALATVFAHLTWAEGSFAPNSGPVLVSEDWQTYAGQDGNPAELWSARDAPGRDWETFLSIAWAADLVIPIIDLGQTDAWAPSTNRGWWGWHLWWARWVFVVMGWVVTALGAAALTGVIRRD
jgi:hypothetical protein